MNYKGFWMKTLGVSEQKIKGGKGDNLKASDADPEQMEKGEKVEKEHSPKTSVARDIAADHVAEHPKYYTKLKKAGLADELDEQTESMMKNGVLALSIRGTPHGTLPVKSREVNNEPQDDSENDEYNETPVMGDRPQDRAAMGGYDPIPIEKENSQGTISDTAKMTDSDDGGFAPEETPSADTPNFDDGTCPACGMNDCQCNNGNDDAVDIDVDDNQSGNLSDLVKGPAEPEVAAEPEGGDDEQEMELTPQGEEEAEAAEEDEEDEEEKLRAMNEELVNRMKKLANIKEAGAAYKVNDGTPHTERPGECDRAKKIQEDPKVLETIQKIEEIVKLHEGDKNLSSSKIGLLNKAKNVLSKWK